MRRYAMFTILAIHVFVSFAATAKSVRPGLPTLVLEEEQGHALELVEIRIHTTIRGHLARTECELTYRNDLNRVVAGNFNYPLPADAELTGLALSFNGRLRHAVAVERERARVAYESTVHRRVDPALVEWSSGRSARLRVYPIPAKGEKQVWLSYDQELLGEPYVLDLRYGKRLRSVDIRIDAEGRFVRDGFAVSVAHPFRLQLFNEALDRRLVTEGKGRDEVLAARDETTRRWYLAAAPRSAETRRSVEPASHIVVFWDSSGSSLHQDVQSIATFLDQFTARQAAGVKVTMIPFDLTVANPIEVSSSSARAQALADLRTIGATNFLAVFARMKQVMREASPGTRVLLVTDGLTSLGSRREIARAIGDLGALGHPLTIVNASPQADDLLLLRLAMVTNGWVADLGRISPEAAVDAVMRQPAPVAFHSAEIPFLASARAGSRVSVAAESDLKPVLPVRELRHPREASMVRAAFARAKLRDLLLSMAPDATILAHGRQFQQLTPRTSLLVLESWRDYKQWGIPMPADVLAEKAAEERRWKREAELASRNTGVTRPPVLLPPSQESASDSAGSWQIDGVATMEDASLPGATITMVTRSETTTTITDSRGRFTFRLDRPPDRFTLRAELAGVQSLTNVVDRRIASGTTVIMKLELGAVSESITVTAEAPTVDVSASATAATFLSSTSSPGDADALVAQLFADAQTDATDGETFEAILKRRREALDAVAAKLREIHSVDERVRYYLTTRSLLGGDKAFHLQAAMAFQSDAPALASRVLSDLAEAYPDDSALLRILARIFDGWNESATARLLLEHALEVAANESQTWRELVLLEARLGNGAGIDRIATMATTIDESVRDEILKEITPLIARWNALPGSIRSGAHDLRLEDETALQVDLMWDTNYTDVDLYVTEPGGEIVMYGHRQSAQNGRLHEDIVSGYGPELYTIARPRPGDYEIAVDYYATDDTEAVFETLAHLVVYNQSRSGVERQEFILLLSKGKEHRTVTKVLVGR